MIELGDAAPAPTKEELIEQLKVPLGALVKTDVRGDVDPEKRYQYSLARKFELYDRGKQYLAPMMVDNQIADWTPIGNSRSTGDVAAYGGRYDHVINLLRGDKHKFVAVLGQRSPVVKVVPDRSDDENALRISRRADLEVKKLYHAWNVERWQRHLANAVWKTTTTFGYVSWVADGQRYGYATEPKYEIQDQPTGPPFYHCMQCGGQTPEQGAGLATLCQNCGAPLSPEDLQPAPTMQAPVVTGTEQYPKGAVEFTLATVFEVTTPFYAREMRDLPWLLYEYDEHKGRILTLYPHLREKLDHLTNAEMGSSTGTETQGIIARDIASSPSATQTKRHNRVLYTRIWLRQAMYELIEDEEKRRMVQENFPTGLKLTFVMDELVDLEDETMDEHWTYCKPTVSEYIYSDPICTDFIGIQDLVNDWHNMSTEIFERSAPWFLYDPQVLDTEAMRKHSRNPGEGVPAKPGAGSMLQNSMWNAPTAKLEPLTMEWIKSLRETGRELTGVLPAIFGAEGPSQTAREAEMKKNQALMQLNVTWAEMRSFWSKIFELGIRMKAKFGAAQGQEEEDGVQEAAATFAEIESGKWHCEAEESMPQTWGQKRDFFMFLLDKGPPAWQFFGLQHPNNLPQVQQIFGMDSWTIPMLNNRDKVYATISKLLLAPPTTNPLTGKVEPSIPIDIFEDDHMISAQVIKEYCQTEQGRANKETNPEGYSNVIAWGMAHQELTMPDPMMVPEGEDGREKPISPEDMEPKRPSGTPPGPQPAPPPQQAAA